MLPPLMRYEVLAFVGWIALFGLVGVGVAATDSPPWVLIAVAWPLVAAQQIYCQIFVPRGARARLLKAVDPTVGPPPGAAPAAPPIIGRLEALSDAKDWRGLRALLSDDFAIVYGKRRFSRRIYIRVLKANDRQLPGERKTDEVVVHPDAPDVVWVRSTTAGKPRFGPGFVSTSWTRVRLTSDGSRVREIADAGVLSVA